MNLGSSLSVLSVAHLGAPTSVHVGGFYSAAFSFRREGELNSSFLSAAGPGLAFGDLSVTGFANIGGGLTITSPPLVHDGSCSVRGEFDLAGSISISSFTRLGSSISAIRDFAIGGGLSVKLKVATGCLSGPGGLRVRSGHSVE